MTALQRKIVETLDKNKRDSYEVVALKCGTTVENVLKTEEKYYDYEREVWKDLNFLKNNH